MTTQDKYTQLMKSNAKAGHVLYENIDAVLWMIEESPAKESMRQMIADYRRDTLAAREAYNAE